MSTPLTASLAPADTASVTTPKGLASRAKALLLTDADDVFDAIDRRRRRRFRRHPLRMHLLYLGGYLAGAVVLARLAGAKAVLAVLAVPVAGAIVAVVITLARRASRHHQTAMQPPPRTNVEPERAWGITLLLLVPSAGLAAFAALLVAVGVAGVLDEGWIGLVGFVVAGLALYPAWLLARAALRIRRPGAPADRSRRRFSLQYAAFGTGVLFVSTLLWSGSFALALLSGFAALTVTAFAAAGAEPSLRRRNRRDG
jgi:hypothetical protein